MSTLSPNEKYLIHLLVCYLQDRKPEPPYIGAKFSALLEIAKRQGILGILTEMLSRLDDVPEKAKQEILSVKLHCIRTDLRLRSVVTEIVNGMEENKIRCMPLKGAEIKSLYRSPHHREMTDIDVLIDFSDAAKVKAWMEQAGFTCEGEAKRNHFNFYREEVVIEFHEKLLDEKEYGAAAFDSVWERASLKEGYAFVYEMDATQTYLYFLFHLLQHYLDSGVGIRFFMDLAVLRQTTEVRWDVVQSVLEEYRLTAFQQGILDLLSAWERDSLTESQILFTKNLLENNLYGASAQRAAQEMIHHGSRSGRIFHALFEPKAVLLEAYPSLRRAPWLYPLYYPHRILRRYFTRKEQAKARWTASKISNERVEQQKQLYEELGLLPIIKGETV